mmetsp:Transcript_34340/g.107319  ORF Transcript_34340/g.107319 Transcript_34340/m.107319 type:complete len:380 (-) Transcript_34340:48-1187(-)
MQPPSTGSANGGEPPGNDDWLTSLEATFRALIRALRPCEGALLFTAGAVSCFYGRHFTYSANFWRAFSVLGWPVTLRAAKELRSRFRAARTAVQRELPQGLPSLQEAGSAASQVLARLQAAYAAYNAAQRSGDAASVERLSSEMESLQEDLSRARQAGSALTAVSAELEPETLLELARGLHAGFLASLKSGLSQSAGMLGLTVNLGDAIASAVNRRASPWLRTGIEHAVSRSNVEVQQLAEDQWARRFLDYAIRAVSSSVGIAVATYVEALAFTLTNARLGATIMVREALAPVRGRLRAAGCELPGAVVVSSRAAEWLLCGYGVYFQVFRGTGIFGSLRRFLPGGYPLSGTMRFVLGVPLLAEAWLAASVMAMRAGILD